MTRYVKPLLWLVNLDDQIRRMARRVPRDESPVQVPSRFVEEWSEESISELDDGSNVQRLEEEERDTGSRTTKLPVKSEGVPSADERSRNLISDPWL